ncbi:hypothetical protein CYMTET_38928 [Cymbomonas tetramitiformis]|uniref:Uncharacterized protein n=1 Tax=Cymbomonas tetramitiformis TaxID=36881 RepID=A0AAE0CB29_9CHLO|nr:hypothetical protein CYMTET_38929 [Cymbomonas tetramitiformis]KAK3251743.1 hypothetical protein CYMTET_38928 [Cymbomonas tetramitiformis]
MQLNSKAGNQLTRGSHHLSKFSAQIRPFDQSVSSKGCCSPSRQVAAQALFGRGKQEKKGEDSKKKKSKGGFNLFGGGGGGKCKVCKGQGFTECSECKGEGRFRGTLKGNIFERNKCFGCQGFGVVGCKACGQKGVTPEQRGER